MKDISLKDLLEAGCHFGHKVTRWHPKAAAFIYQSREGVHIIDLVKTRDWLKKAAEFVFDLGKSGKLILFVASKRQAKGVVTEAAKRAGLPYMTNRWIGGFITNWDEVKKNIEKMNTWRKEQKDGSWDQFPKHEIVKLNKKLRQVELVYSGVENLTMMPEAIFIVDINKEIAALKEATRKGITTVVMVDTNANPLLVDYPIPANDDAVGSIQYVVNYITDAYLEGKKLGQKKEEKEPIPVKTTVKQGKKKEDLKQVEPAAAKAKAGKKEEKEKEKKEKKNAKKSVKRKG